MTAYLLETIQMRRPWGNIFSFFAERKKMKKRSLNKIIKTLMKDTEEFTNKQKVFHGHGLEELTLSTLLNLKGNQP